VPGGAEVAFKLAETGAALLDLADLRALLSFVRDNHQEIFDTYGLVSNTRWRRSSAGC